MPAIELGYLLRSARGERSLNAAATRIGVSPMAYRAWEHGFSQPRPNQAAGIAAFLALPQDQVLAMLTGPEESWLDVPPEETPPAPPPPACNGADAFQLFRDWWADVPRRLGPTTCKLYRRELFTALADLGKHPNAILARHIEAHLGEMRPQHASLRRAALSDFFKWMEAHGHRRDNPLATIKQPKIGRQKVRRSLTEEELFRLWNAALLLGRHPGMRGFAGEALGWAILAQYGLCLRPGELCNLTKDRISLNGATSCAYIIETKTGNDRTVPVVGVARVALEALLALSPATSNRIVHISTKRYYELFHAAAEVAGLPPEKCRPYAMRHTGATHLAERGVHPRTIAEILGHVDLRHVMTYTQPGDETLREALRKLDS